MNNYNFNWSYLCRLYYGMGKQLTNIGATKLHKDDDVLKWKWKHFEEMRDLNHSDCRVRYMIGLLNNRTQLHNEIILELDAGKMSGGIHIPTRRYAWNMLLQRLISDGLYFEAYRTAEYRCTHVLTYWSGLASVDTMTRRNIRTDIISKYGCDMSYRSDYQLIPFGTHWRSEKEIRRTYVREGINHIRNIYDSFIY